MPNLQNPIFTDESEARAWPEARVWPNGPVCPHCGATGDDVTRLEGKARRPDFYSMRMPYSEDMIRFGYKVE
jgi:Transposase zinc-ribbon domain